VAQQESNAPEEQQKQQQADNDSYPRTVSGRPPHIRELTVTLRANEIRSVCNGDNLLPVRSSAIAEIRTSSLTNGHR
jgi:hypothetical protein